MPEPFYRIVYTDSTNPGDGEWRGRRRNWSSTLKHLVWLCESQQLCHVVRVEETRYVR